MSIIAVPKFFWPNQSVSRVNTTTTNAGMTTLITFDAATDELLLVTRIPKTGTLTAVEFHTGTVSTAGATFAIALETPPTDGVTPTGTLITANANGTVVVGTGDDNVFMSVPINSGTGVSVTKGTPVAIRLSVSSGTPDTVIVNVGSLPSEHITLFPYLVTNTAASYVKNTATFAASSFVLNYGGTYEPLAGGNPISDLLFTTPANGAEIALRFQTPVPLRICGGRVFMCNITAAADFRFILYDATPTIITGDASGTMSVEASADIDGDLTVFAGSDGWYEFEFPDNFTTVADTTYYASIYRKTANALVVMERTVPSAAYLAALHSGAQCYKGTRSGGTGVFTDSQTGVPVIELAINGVHDGAGGGGGMRLAGPGGLAA